MDKNLFTTLLQRYTGSSVEEAEEVVALKTEYPYSQLLQTLVARVSKDHGFSFHQEALQMAAIHAADRGVLKEIITAQPDDVETEAEPETPVAAPFTPVTVQGIPAPTPEFKVQRNDGADVADELMRDLDKLNTLKNNFEMLLVEYSEVQTEEKAEPAIKEPVPVQQPVRAENPEPRKTPVPRPEPPDDHDDEAPAPKKKAKSKKQRIIELAKAMNAAEITDEKDLEAGYKTEQSGARSGNPTDELIEEIRVTKEEIVPESERQKEQMEIINHFIKIQPSISNAKDRQAHPIGDLNPIKSGEFGDNIVSETLVEILVRQGKKDKAIEVLKKLIWKYPQKKSYFASQIEDLKK